MATNLRSDMPYQLSATMNDVIGSNQWPTLVIFCKRPKLHQGKQRIAQSLCSDDTLKIAKGLLACAIEDSLAWLGPAVIACSDPNDVSWAQALNNRAYVLAQLPLGESGNLGQRLNYVDQTLRNLGHQKMIIIGTDAPMLTAEHYQNAASALNDHDIVLSHAADGGVVIMANRKPWPKITNLPWSTGHLSHSLAMCCQDNKLNVHYIQPGYDIDVLEDIKKLITDIREDARPARQQLLKILTPLLISSGVTHHA